MQGFQKLKNWKYTMANWDTSRRKTANLSNLAELFCLPTSKSHLLISFTYSIFWNLSKQWFWLHFWNDDSRSSIFTCKNEEDSCPGPHVTQNNGGVRIKKPFEKVYQPYNGPTIRKFSNIYLISISNLGEYFYQIFGR